MHPILTETNHPNEAISAGERPLRRVTINLAESPLGWLRARGLVTDRQCVAGEALRRDYERAQLGARVTMQWDAPPQSRSRRVFRAPSAQTIAQLSAKQRFDAVITHVGPGLADISWRIICACEAMPVAEKALGWPARSGRLVLTLALDRIADYYHIP